MIGLDIWLEYCDTTVYDTDTRDIKIEGQYLRVKDSKRIDSVVTILCLICGAAMVMSQYHIGFIKTIVAGFIGFTLINIIEIWLVDCAKVRNKKKVLKQLIGGDQEFILGFNETAKRVIFGNSITDLDNKLELYKTELSNSIKEKARLYSLMKEYESYNEIYSRKKDDASSEFCNRLEYNLKMYNYLVNDYDRRITRLRDAIESLEQDKMVLEQEKTTDSDSKETEKEKEKMPEELIKLVKLKKKIEVIRDKYSLSDKISNKILNTLDEMREITLKNPDSARLVTTKLSVSINELINTLDKLDNSNLNKDEKNKLLDMSLDVIKSMNKRLSEVLEQMKNMEYNDIEVSLNVLKTELSSKGDED